MERGFIKKDIVNIWVSTKKINMHGNRALGDKTKNQCLATFNQEAAIKYNIKLMIW
jgi:hypothetical protein